MTAENQRSYPRANTLLPFAVRRLGPDESREPRCRIATDVIVIDDSRPPVLKDESLDRWLNMLNAKLDYLIRQAAPQREPVVFMTFEPVNISAGGMSLVADERFGIGDILEIRIVLETYPSKILYFYGELVRVEAAPRKSGGYTASLKFLGMDDDVRDEILKFDFKKHRKRLIGSKKA
ncbi:MAG: PilZ domain-containing protein [Deltaproteobacteria bacterium]|nr:PilZ domain-containing protein [Deltaproteobacteria bacterium]